jgi:hypothetical protein
MRNKGNNAGIGGATYSTQLFTDSGAGDFEIYNSSSTYGLVLGTSATARLKITSAGNVGIGTTSPSQRLAVYSGVADTPAAVTVGDTQDRINLGWVNGGAGNIILNQTPSQLVQAGVDTALVARGNFASNLLFYTSAGSAAAERARIDQNGRLLVGTSSARDNFFNASGFGGLLQVEGVNSNAQRVISNVYGQASGAGAVLALAKHRSNSIGGNTIVNSGDELGILSFQGSDGSEFVEGARIEAGVDGTPGANDMPGRLVLSTTADGASSPTERMRIDSQGRVGIGSTSPQGLLHILGGGSQNLVLQNTGADARLCGLKNASGAMFIGSLGATGVSDIIFNRYGEQEAMRLDSSGRLLVGTSTSRNVGSSVPAQIQVETLSTGIAYSAVRNSADVVGSYLTLGKSRGTSVGATTIVNSSDVLGSIRFAGADGTDLTSYGGEIRCEVDGTPGTDDMPGRLVFSTTADGASSPTERMRINASGSTVFSSADTVYSLSTAAAGTTNIVFLGRYGVGSPTSGTNSVIIWNNGNIVNTNNSYGSLSDIKLKENIVDANSQWNDLKALQVRNYNFKEGQTHTQIGLIAQEVELVSPGLVSESPDRDAEGNDLGTVTKSVNYSVLYMKAVKALQEAMERIEVLEAKVNALEGI